MQKRWMIYGVFIMDVLTKEQAIQNLIEGIKAESLGLHKSIDSLLYI